MASVRRAAAAAGLAGALLLSVPILLRAGGPGINLPGTQPSDGSGDPAFPPFIDDTTTGTAPGTFDRPGVCDNCHQGYRRAGEAMYEPWDTWAGSMMANSARDPLLWAALDVANQDDSARLGNAGIGDFCLRCHVPKGWYEGRSHCDTAWGEHFDGSCLLGDPSVIDSDFEGIFCAVCHRSFDASNPPPGQLTDPNAPYVGNGQLYFETAERQMLGPYSDAQPLSHTFVQSQFHRGPRICAQCHDVTNPALNRRDPATGADLGYRMPIERTYSEYSQSKLGDSSAPEYRTCEQCHMPEPDLNGDNRPDAGYACQQEPGLRGETTALEGPLRMHVFAGANTFMLGVLRGEYATPMGRDAMFANGIAATTTNLRRAVGFSVNATGPIMAGDTLSFSARVTNLTGHKFPTGYPEGRRVWLEATVGEDRNGDSSISPDEIVWQSGAWDPATGVLTQDAQLKTYEAKPGVWDFNGDGRCDVVDAAGSPMFHFATNDCWLEDNRIPPLGFVPNAETQPVGYAYADNPSLPGTLQNWDDTSWNAPIPPTATSDLLVQVRVLYQSSSKEYIDFLRAENRSTCDPFDDLCDPTQPDGRSNRGEKMHDLWERYGRSAPEEVAVARVLVRLTIPPPSACCVLGTCADLDPATCVAQEGDFHGGQACATFTCPPLDPPGEASNVFTGAAPLRVSKSASALAITYSPACAATDHEIVAGPLGGVSTYASSIFECGIGTSGSTTLDPGAGSWWLVIAGRNDVAEGSYGRDSRGTERPQHAGVDPCDRPQSLAATCR